MTTAMTRMVAMPPRARSPRCDGDLDMDGEPCMSGTDVQGGTSRRHGMGATHAISGAAFSRSVLASVGHVHLPGHHHFVSGRHRRSLPTVHFGGRFFVAEEYVA